MAIGIAALMGFQLPNNFNSPYQSLNLTEFWHRWHITLSQWFRDYIYIPLGGNRKGELNTYRNTIITMIVAGLWHGASGMFALWGGLHGIGLTVHKFACNRGFNKNSQHHICKDFLLDNNFHLYICCVDILPLVRRSHGF